MLQMNQVMKLWMAELSTQSYEFMRWLSNEFVRSCMFKYDLLCANDVRVRSIAFSNNQMFLFDSHCGSSGWNYLHNYSTPEIFCSEF